MIRRDFWSGKRVFVTGHTGFKGGWLALWLDALGASLRGYALEAPTRPSLWEKLKLSTRFRGETADVRDAARLAGAVAQFRPDIVFHLAAQPIVRASYDDPVQTYATNVMGTVHLLEAVRRCGGRCAVVNVTSDKCYANAGRARRYREADPMGGHDPYSSSKGCAELVTAAWRDSYGLRLASARAGNVFGGGDWAADRLIPDLVRAALAREPARIRNPGAVRPWQHVLEPLHGYLALAERLWESADAAGGWNFGPAQGDAVTVGRLADMVVARWGQGAAWTAEPGEHPREASTLELDCAKARARLGWRALLALPEALDWTVEWYRADARRADVQALCLEQIRRFEERAHGA